MEPDGENAAGGPAGSSEGSSSEHESLARPKKRGRKPGPLKHKSEKPVKPKQTAAGKASPKRKAVGGAAKGGKGKRFCRGCAKFWPSDDFPANHNLHLECKRAKDSLHNMAKRQGEAEWFREVEFDDARFQKLIAEFKARQSQSSAGKAKFAIAVFKESTKSSQSIINDDVGEMMCEESYLIFAATVKGGKKNPKQAKLEWDRMAADLGSRIHDKHGPADAPLRIRITTKELVILRNAFERAKTLEASTAAVKNADESKLTKMANEVLQSSMVANDDNLNDMLGVARDMKKSGAGLSEDGATFSTPFQNGFIADVKAGMDKSSSQPASQDSKRATNESTSQPTERAANHPPCLPAQHLLLQRLWCRRTNLQARTATPPLKMAKPAPLARRRRTRSPKTRTRIRIWTTNPKSKR